MTRNHWARSSRQWAEIGMTAPLVIAERLARIGAAGMRPTAADRRETRRMVSEKVDAGWQSAAAYWQQAWIEQQRLAWTWWWDAWLGATRAGKRSSWSTTLRQVERAAARATSASLTPVQRRVRANARRLRRR